MVLFVVLCFTLLSAPARSVLFSDYFCSQLLPEEFEKWEKMGKCVRSNATTEAPGSTTTEDPNRGNFFERTQKKVLKQVYVTKSKDQDITLTKEAQEVVLLEGAHVTLHCDVANKDGGVTWYFNHRQIGKELMGWRLAMEEMGTILRLRPALADKDQGRIQCYQDSIIMGSVNLEILTASEALGIGYLNFLITIVVGLPIILLAVWVNLNKDPEKEVKIIDPVTQFLEEELNVTAKKMKRTLKKSADVHKKALEHPVAAGKMHTVHLQPTQAVDPDKRTNKHTVMTFIAMGERRDGQNMVLR